MTNIHDLTYSVGLADILANGEVHGDRTGTGTLSTFGLRQVYDISTSFPAITTKKLAWKAVVSELLWFLEGSGDERRLAEILHGTRDESVRTIWTDNANADYWKGKAQYPGDCGTIYGVQWRSWTTPTGEKIDQLKRLIDGIISKPNDRRHILTAWNPGELDNMALPPCHSFAQFYVRNNGMLDCQMYQRSNDFFLGCPFNIASYALLTYMVAHVTGYNPGKLVHISGDAHIYSNHTFQVQELMSRDSFAPPTLILNPTVRDINKFTMSDITLVDYQSHAAIKAPMAI